MTGKVLVLGVESKSGWTPTMSGQRAEQPPRGGHSVDAPARPPEESSTAVLSQLRLDSTVTVLSVKAAK